MALVVVGAGLTVGLALMAVGVARSDRFKSFAFTCWVFAFAAAAISFPSVFISWGSFELRNAIAPLVQVIMFAMGTTLTVKDFARIARMPKSVLIGCTLQFTVMPLMAATFAAFFGLRSEVAMGLLAVILGYGR